MKKIILLLIPLILTLNSCIRFAVLSPTTQASSLSDKEASFCIGNYARFLSFETRKGIFKNNFIGNEIGLFLAYSLQDSYFKSISILSDLKVSFFEQSKTKLASGIGLSYLYLSENTNNIDYYLNSIYLVLPIYMESSLTEWFKFISNYRLFTPIVNDGIHNQKLTNYKKTFLTINIGILLFQTLNIEGYMLAGENLEAFPIPGFSLTYSIKF